MAYKLIGNNDYNFNPLSTIFKNRGIENPKSFIDVNQSSVIHFSKLDNIDKASDCLIKHLENKNKIFVQVDSDVDGYTSSSIIINYIKAIYPKADIRYRIHEDKEHGIFIDTIPDDVDLVLIPDAGSGQFEEHEALNKRGTEIIVIDHHECERESEHAIVVNNQLSPNYSNKTLTGAGMAYKFCQAVDEKLNKNEAEQFLDLVSIGNIADSADSRNLETRYFMNEGLKKIKHPLLKKLFKKQDFSTKGDKNIQNTQFFINPLINAAIRVGSSEEKDQMMRAFLLSKEKVPYKKRGQSETELVSIHDDTVRILGNLKAKQKRIADAAGAEIKNRIEEKSLTANKVLIVYIEGILDKSLTGLVANQLAEEYKKPVLLARNDPDKGEDILSGSIRGYDKGFIKDFKKVLIDTGLFEFVEGHPNAAGFAIKRQNLIMVNKVLNEKFKDIDIEEDVQNVDFEIPANQLRKEFLIKLYSYKDYWGYKVEEPLVAITELEVDVDQIEHIGKKNKTTIKFKHGDIEYIRFKSDTEYFEKLTQSNGTLILNVVGKARVNEYKGRQTPQIEIYDLEVVCTKKKELVF
ncbi:MULTISPECIES: single-stranded-DNA-specific exonuclease RecJ [Bacillus amyloliquefaciens group]|uniref:Single-stranded-DNA-specific exonuclease RecJ n=1 Tax=Bacillus amyloliquefaciens TaxID=1390 RepID=A0AAP3YGW2_BACAM|nr:single-stranded-DNA-specific exonuclease RecJ [Bacillus amyloliquefaciens]MDF4194869.1 single-stranded-DNA-specific exonuclease RecJ [Bacillus amyloliquefaciens]MDF4213105.1 single-stranded-DNA-specific exonuclease RecJ [Bacillus amyloliquefaciens]